MTGPKDRLPLIAPKAADALRGRGGGAGGMYQGKAENLEAVGEASSLLGSAEG